jgi:hypothetical protein
MKTIITTDASEIGLGAVLSQIDHEGVERPLAFVSRALTRPERDGMQNLERELYAIVIAIDRFRPIIGSTFVTIRTDCSGLTGKEVLSPSSKITRWLLKIREQPHSIQHVPGEKNIVADALSRLIRVDRRGWHY